jgi:hypothetical protein
MFPFFVIFNIREMRLKQKIPYENLRKKKFIKVNLLSFKGDRAGASP